MRICSQVSRRIASLEAVTGARRELVSRRAREAVRDFMSGTTLREIDELWQDELFAPVFEDPEPVGGQRVTHYQGYLDQVDWTDQAQVFRALRVFEASLAWAFNPATGFNPPTERLDRLRRLFARDGITWSDDGKVLGQVHEVVDDRLLSSLSDPAVIHEHLHRIGRAVHGDDPAQAIGSAKELIESTAKVVLRERGIELTGREEIPELVKAAQESLLLHPTQVEAGPDSAPSVRRILGASSNVANGVAELRNAGFGTGHGQGNTRSGLGRRHARLAVNAARLWCEFVLDTLADPQAPWRRLLTADDEGPGAGDV